MNDYARLLKSTRIRQQVSALLNNELPDDRKIPYNLEVELTKASRFIECSFTSKSSKKAELAAQATVIVFNQEIRNIMSLKEMQIVEPVKLLPSPVAPRKLRLAVVFGFLAGSLCFLYYLLRDFFHDVIDSPDKLAALGVPLLGTVKRIQMSEGEETTNMLIGLQVKENNKYRFNSLYEAFQLILTNLQYSVPSKKTAKRIVVSSVAQGEGKSFFSSNLAMLLAEKGFRVLLLGSDFRRPGLHQYYAFDRSFGLVNVVLGEKTFEEVVYRNVHGYSLDLLLAGPIPPNPMRVVDLF